MRFFDYSKYKRKKWDNEILRYIALIHEYKAKQEIYSKQKAVELEKLVEIAKVQSTEASNSIEGIRTTNIRLKQLLIERTTPRNRDEEEIAGYRDVLNIIHENYPYIDLTPNYLLQLHKTLYNQSSKEIGGKYKDGQNYVTGTDTLGNDYIIFTPLSAIETPIAVENLFKEFNKALMDSEVDPLILIPIFIHDFLCIHPFSDGNGRMSRLLTTLLLYKCGYMIGRYISLEAKIAQNKNLYYIALEQAQENWHEGNDNPEEFIKYILGTIISAYRDLDDRIEIINNSNSSVEIVKKTIGIIIGKFSKSLLVEMCPTISVKSIELALKQLTDEGLIEKCGVGKSTFYIRKNL